MSYDVRDILRKSIQIACKNKDLIKDIQEEQESLQNQLVAKVISRQIDNEINKYYGMIQSIDYIETEFIDFDTYDCISKKCNELHRLNLVYEIEQPKHIINLAINLDSSMMALYIDIQGRLVKNPKTSDTHVYRVLSDLIQFKRDRIEQLKKF